MMVSDGVEDTTLSRWARAAAMRSLPKGTSMSMFHDIKRMALGLIADFGAVRISFLEAAEVHCPSGV